MKEYGTRTDTFDGTDVPIFEHMHTIHGTGGVGVTHNTAVTPEGTVLPMIQGVTLAGLIDAIEEASQSINTDICPECGEPKPDAGELCPACEDARMGAQIDRHPPGGRTPPTANTSR